MNLNYYWLAMLLVSFLSCKQNASSEKEPMTEDQTTNTEITFHKLESAVLAGGSLWRKDSFPTQFVIPRTVDVWLPENYSTENKYAVLYMHDGQNLFDANTTWNNQEWMIDEIGTKLMNDGDVRDFMVVGIHNVSDIRHGDYFPKKANDYLPQKIQDSLLDIAKKGSSRIPYSLNADEYLKFIVEELKPFIDKNYSTLPDPQNTMVSGSSMGGLISMYAICEYPEVFGNAACISTHWPGIMPQEGNPVPAAILQYLDENVPNSENHKLYFDYGTATLDAYYPPFKQPVDSIFAKNGYSEKNYQNLQFEGADHSEQSWQKRFDIPLKFLFGK